jgi:hypothetical protein
MHTVKHCAVSFIPSSFATTWLTKAVFEPPTGANNRGTDLNGAKASSKVENITIKTYINFKVTKSNK